ncbi:MAG: hypothetical protein K2L05_03215 [Muribaculaceae bacterium]|nr:hypothetical protein [Muribaculaceae bacterium]
MKNTPAILLAATLLLASACSSGWNDNRRAANYADRIEDAEAVSASEYSEMVTFYCSALDRTLQELQPYHEAHAKALNSGDTAQVAKTQRELTEKTEQLATGRKHLKRLGTALFLHMGELPDTTRHRLLTHLAGIRTHYQNL